MSHGAVATASTGVGSSLGGRVYSFALGAVTDTKDTLILVCLALLEALDRLQERLHLPTTLVKDLKRKLAKMIDLSPSPSGTAHRFGSAGRAIGAKLADSDMWEVAKPEEVRGIVQWTIDVIKYLSYLMISSSLCVCRGIFILIMRVPGVSTACALFYRVLQFVEDTVQLSSDTIRDLAAAGASAMSTSSETGGTRGFHHSRRHHQGEVHAGDSSLTAVVLEYREKECMVPSNIDQRIRRVMHFQIPLRSFEATVRLPPNHSHESTTNLVSLAGAANMPTESGACGGPISSSSPRSIPASPRARRRVQLAFSNFSDDVLYQARDRLRIERAATVTGTRDLLVPLFNAQDCNEEIFLSCGRHCATKVGPGMYRSVRGSVEVPRHRQVYFEMTLQEARSPSRASTHGSRLFEPRSHSSEASPGSSAPGHARVGGGADASVCIGVSTRSMALNSLVGTTRYSVGFYSAGHVLVGANRRSFVAVNRGYGFQSTVGVMVKIENEGERTARQHGDANGRDGGESARRAHPQLSIAIPQPVGAAATAVVRFSVNGAMVRDCDGEPMEFALPFPAQSELYPTLTLHSQGVQVFGRFSASDIAAANVGELVAPREDSADVWCLDGQRLLLPP